MDFAPAVVASHIAPLLPTFAAQACAGARLMHDRRMAPLWNTLGGEAGIALVPVHGPGPGRLYDLMLESDAGVLAIAVCSVDDTLLAMASATGVGGRLRSLVVDALLDETIVRLREYALPGARVVALSPITEPRIAPDGWCALRRGDTELCRVAVQSLGPDVAEALIAARAPVPAAVGWRRAMRLPASVVVAERSMRVRQLKSLEIGDVVLFETAARSLEGAFGALRVCGTATAHLGAPCRIAGDSLTLLEGLSTMDQDYLPDLATADSPGSIGELEIPLRFEIETVSIPLSELEAVEPGYVIEFGTPVSQARLKLISCGLVIGEASLIAIGDRMGARITHLVPRDE